MTTKTTIRDLLAAAALLWLIVACVPHPGESGSPNELAGRPPGDATGNPLAWCPTYGTDAMGSDPMAGAFFSDGSEDDIRARTKGFLPPRIRDIPVDNLRSANLAKAHTANAHAVDELVVIERADGTRATYGPDRIAALRAQVEGCALGQPLPLEHTDVDAQVALNISSVKVTQRFCNPFSSKIEAVYVFPLPQDAAVSDFVMVLGERRIRGIVRERDEARRIYEQARAAGHRASLLSQERPNVFLQAVANIEPGERIDVETTYFQSLPWRDGAFEMVVPTVVGPRFHPAGTDDGIGAVAAGAEGTSGQPVEVPYRVDADGTGPGIGIRVALDAGMPLATITCGSHPVTIARDGEQRAEVTLRDGVAVPNRDFVLRFAPRATDLGGAVAVHRDPETGDGWFAMLLQPPLAEVEHVVAEPREMVFVVDCSGSMSGEPLAACKRAMRRCLERLGPDDTFTIVRFSDRASSLGPEPLAATPANVRRGLAFVDALASNGGTHMELGITAALQPPVPDGRRRIVTFMTDGFIGNEKDILRAVHEHVGRSRIFSFGVGTSVNRYLLERMADMGRGVAAYVDLSDSAQQQVDELFARLARPALSDLTIDWHGADVHCVEPQQLPDLFVGRPLLVHGAVHGTLPDTVTVRGKVGRTERTFALPVGDSRAHPAIARLWARASIRTLSDRSHWVATPDELTGEIERIALAHGLASSRTSFVAVDSAVTTAGDHGTTVPVSVPTPRGVRYETAVGGQR